MPETDTMLELAAKCAATAVSLRYELEAKEADYKAAKEAYEKHVKHDVPELLERFGLTAVTLNDGNKITIKTNYKCSPNKNDADRARMLQWLKAHGGESIVKEHLVVGKQMKSELLDKRIPFVEDGSVNTSSLKAWLKGQLGVDGGTAMLSPDDIPDYLHWYEEKEAVFV